MSNIIGIVNYGVAGNMHSIKKAIEKAGGSTLTIGHPSDFEKVNKIVLPGVGSFKDAMKRLHNDGFLEPLKSTTKPILGICLGMQILSTLGFEFGETKGLGLIKAEVKPIIVNSKVPHVGYNTIETLRDCKLLKGIEGGEFYFMHSFEVVNYTDIVALTEYGGHFFVSVIQKNNLYGVQFHPEKSRNTGIQLFKNFVNL